MKLGDKDWPKEWPTEKEIKAQLALGTLKKYIIYPAGSPECPSGPIFVAAWNMKCAMACIVSKYKIDEHKWLQNFTICHEYNGNAEVDIWCFGIE